MWKPLPGQSMGPWAPDKANLVLAPWHQVAAPAHNPTRPAPAAIPSTSRPAAHLVAAPHLWAGVVWAAKDAGQVAATLANHVVCRSSGGGQQGCALQRCSFYSRRCKTHHTAAASNIACCQYVRPDTPLASGPPLLASHPRTPAAANAPNTAGLLHAPAPATPPTCVLWETAVQRHAHLLWRFSTQLKYQLLGQGKGGLPAHLASTGVE